MIIFNAIRETKTLCPFIQQLHGLKSIKLGKTNFISQDNQQSNGSSDVKKKPSPKYIKDMWQGRMSKVYVNRLSFKPEHDSDRH